ncbi:arylesterase [Desulfococcus multivorans]|uniref:Lipase/acylhydrolase n=1 Tax=Desulfococcus multivorans DSM 2059 TaxID=1121405 RepID=S7UHG7_DESML|nr:arylesterase [Desulfococcus multivorans]AOY59338.1 GDSL-like lipase/acylhydrolase [Desulfococcus multivorans]AQV01554.1 arylesterase [Desulfococcus multivorans]EPR33289.1 lipase/acylhydrolase [Desulfococcus multivorans DSM 2059]SKA14258.1 acyl-CoA thioesterase-1 [Desulfococcus multivorans DSM 2059]
MKPSLLAAVLLAVLTATVFGGCDKAPKAGTPEASGALEAAAPDPNETGRSGVIVAVGNSLTEGYGVDEEQAYPALLEKKLKASGHDFNVINAGISGETSSGALSRIQWIMTLNPDIVILETGANDGLRGIDPDLTRKNLFEIVRRLENEGVVVVLAGMRMVLNLGLGFTDAFREIYPSVAAEADVILIPFFLEGVAGDPRLNQADGIHPNPDGYRIVADTVYPYAVAAIERLRTRRN